MRRIERLRSQLEGLERRRLELLRNNRYTDAARLIGKIEDLKDLVAEAEEYEPKPIGQLIDEATLRDMRICDMIVELHLAADFMADCAFALRSALGKLGLRECELFPLIDDITKKTEAFAGRVCRGDFPGLTEFMCNNETLIDEMHDACQRYASNNLRITFNEQPA